MNFLGTGFITVIIYASNSGALIPDNALLTEANDPILTEGSDNILTEQ